MSDEVKRIRICVESEIRGEKQIPAVLVADIFQRIQNVLYYIVDDLEGNAPRKGGDFPNSVKERAQLVITEMCIGSVEAQLTISDTQMGLPGVSTFGEKAIAIADEILDAISEGDDLASMISGAINNRTRQDRILHEFDLLWPDKQSKYGIVLGFGADKDVPLDPSCKQNIRNALNRLPEKSEKSIIGRLMEVRVDRRRTFQVDTVDGQVTCAYTPELEDRIVESIGHLVRIRGIMALESDGKYTLGVRGDNSIEDLKELPLNEVKLRGRTLELKEPLHFDISYDDDEYLAVNDKFRLMSSGPTLKAVVEGINEEIESLWEDYVEASLEELSQDALDLRGELMSAFGGETSDVKA